MNDLEVFLEQSPTEFRELLKAMHQLIREYVPESIPQSYRKGDQLLLYGTGYAAKMEICYLRPFKKHINLGFSLGTQLPDPYGLLEGTGKTFRHVKIRQPADLEQTGLPELLREAVALHKQVNS